MDTDFKYIPGQLVKAANKEKTLSLDSYLSKVNIPKILENKQFKYKSFSLNLCYVSIILDSTASQTDSWDAIQNGIEKIIEDIARLADIELKIAIIAYRDYCDHKVIEFHPYTSDINKLKSFSKNIECTGGGANDAEASELGLNKAKNLYKEISSTKKGKGIFVLIGDEAAYGVKVSLNKKKANDIFWLDEVNEIKDLNVPIYSIFTGYDEKDRNYFDECSKLTKGKLFNLSSIDTLSEMLISILTGIIAAEIGELDNYQNLLIFDGRNSAANKNLLEDLRSHIAYKEE